MLLADAPEVRLVKYSSLHMLFIMQYLVYVHTANNSKTVVNNVLNMSIEFGGSSTSKSQDIELVVLCATLTAQVGARGGRGARAGGGRGKLTREEDQALTRSAVDVTRVHLQNGGRGSRPYRSSGRDSRSYELRGRDPRPYDWSGRDSRP